MNALSSMLLGGVRAKTLALAGLLDAEPADPRGIGGRVRVRRHAVLEPLVLTTGHWQVPRHDWQTVGVAMSWARARLDT